MNGFTLAHTYLDNVKQEAADDFKKKLGDVANYGSLSLAIALGSELDLFNALSEVSDAEKPATAEMVYVFEWLRCMTCGEIVESDESGTKFWIPEERLETLTGTIPSLPVATTKMNVCFSGAFKQMLRVFSNDGPLGIDYAPYSDFHATLAPWAMLEKHLVQDLIPTIGAKEKLCAGARVLGVGCGGGCQAVNLAHHFPKSHFTGVDITEAAISDANKAAAEKNVTNVEFHRVEARELPKDWEDSFDLVFMFDACHDQMRPDLALAEAHRVLKPDGLFTMIETNGTGNCYRDRYEIGSEALFFYVASIFHCLPVGSNSQDALGLGTMCGTQKVQKLLKESGFKNVGVHQLDFAPMSALYTARK
ncbi:protein R08E5.3 [Aphelenchoides avenae]|nr:protein R08E5.3 [Aphelenchus avenae]